MAPGIDRATMRGIVAMVVALFGFVVNDSIVKLLSEELPLGEIIFLRAVMATLAIGLLVHLRGEWPTRGMIADRGIQLRNVGELGGTVFYLTALTGLPLANASAILQAMPFVITAAAALILGERVGWRRWTSILVGFAGVLMIVRPGAEGFNAYSLYAVVAVGFITLRDMATRYVAKAVPTLTITLMTNVVIIALALAMGLFESWALPSPRQLMLIAGAAFFLMIGYIFVIRATREGEVSIIAPFRYTIIVWALMIDFAVWGKVPTAMTVAGIVVIVASGLYMFFRERKVASSADRV